MLQRSSPDPVAGRPRALGAVLGRLPARTGSLTQAGHLTRTGSHLTRAGSLTRTGQLVRASQLALVGCLALTACGVPPELAEPGATATRRTPTPTVTATGVPTTIPTSRPAPTPSPTALVACTGGPSRDQVSALLRRSANLPRSARVTFQVGPLCVEDWQYSVVAVTGREPLQAVTRGRPNNLRLVTAGTDVCNIPVRAEAPAALRAAACDAVPPTVGGL